MHVYVALPLTHPAVHLLSPVCTLAGACKLAAAMLGIDLLALRAGKVFLPDIVDAEYLLKKVVGADDALVTMHGPDDADVTVSAKLQKMTLRLNDGGVYYILRFRRSAATGEEQDSVRKTIVVDSALLPAPVSAAGSSAEEHLLHTQHNAGSTLRHRVAPLTATLTTTTTSARWSRASDPDTGLLSSASNKLEDGSCQDLLFGGPVEEQSLHATHAQVHRGRPATPRFRVGVANDASSASFDNTAGVDISPIPDAPVVTSTSWQKPTDDRVRKSIKFHPDQHALGRTSSLGGGSREGGPAPGSVYSKSSSHQSSKSSTASEVLRRTISASSTKLEPSLTLLVRAFSRACYRKLVEKNK